MLCTKYGLGQSLDCPVQTSDPSFVQQPLDWLCNPRITINEVCKLWMNAQFLDCPCLTIIRLYPKLQQVGMKREKQNWVTSIENHGTYSQLWWILVHLCIHTRLYNGIENRTTKLTLIDNSAFLYVLCCRPLWMWRFFAHFSKASQWTIIQLAYICTQVVMHGQGSSVCAWAHTLGQSMDWLCKAQIQGLHRTILG